MIGPAQWYYAAGEQQQGPIAEADLRDMLLAGELPPSTLVWSEGMANWVSAEKVPDLYQVPPASAPTVSPQPLETTTVDSPQPVLGAHGPSMTATAIAPENVVRGRQAWNRFLARVADGFLFSLVLGVFLGFSSQEQPTFLDAALASALSLGLFAFLEAWFLSRWGMTPGKWVFRIRVVHQEQRFLTYGEALRRAFQVLVQGMFFGIPPMVLVFEGLAFKELVDQGETQWDKRLGCEVQHAPMRLVHRIVAALICLSLLLWAFAVTAA